MIEGTTGAVNADDDNLRERAVERLKQKKLFWVSLATFLFFWGVCWVIWLVTGARTYGGYVPWPTWMAFWGIAVVWQGIRVYGDNGHFESEATVQREMDKLRGH